MNAYQTADADRAALYREQDLADYIVDSARECGTDSPCLDFCPYYMVSLGICNYGCAFPRCRVGRILNEEGIR